MRSKIFLVLAAVIAILAAGVFLREPISCFFYLRSSPQNLIAFTGLDGIYVMDNQGNLECRVTEGNFEMPLWSYDGRQIAFVNSDSNSISVVNVDGSGLRNLSHVHEDFPIRNPPSWSPDSTEL